MLLIMTAEHFSDDDEELLNRRVCGGFLQLNADDASVPILSYSAFFSSTVLTETGKVRVNGE